MEKKNIAYLNTTVLAYLGDSVYEMHVRKHVFDTGQVNADRLHQSAVKYVRAEAQAYALKEMLEELTESELALVKRARNKKITSKPKNADPVIYKWATAFEALIGYLYLAQEEERLTMIIQQTLEAIERNKGIKNVRKTDAE
ncbi:Mini-ribonuclease 3 [Sinanaerobacter chloroacetimidivorans]|uniref:Mini-ribonuclease 3 n=1 Tax=Sinanaerobacter chloroacetimidivorans TaxID=2818044 RepID=A0A8J7W151_9FIRM|nr:ribonuclease III domain-containing protein [Sinanaerobacter chloroacetimidivorans]MBR0597285.1 ribonuclease III [Sinanaerobacter chloroacetimidivorans]